MSSKPPLAVSTAAIISTGTEILQGLYADENARYLAEQLSKIGIEVVLVSAAPDDPEEIEETIRHAASRADLVVCTGGLGPTVDDVNRDVFARIWNMPLLEDQRALEMMRGRFRARGRGEMPASNAVQAQIPAEAEVFHNHWGTAPGFYIQRTQAAPALMAFPGPPSEMRPMFQQFALPILTQQGSGGRCSLVRTLHTFSLPESEVNERCRALFTADPDVRITILAKTYGVDLRLFTAAGSPAEAAERLNVIADKAHKILGEQVIYGCDDDTMASSVAAPLLNHGATVATAESCTGGWISKLLTDVPGSSGYLKQSHVVYSNEAKVSLLGVPSAAIEQHGAVSELTVRAMAAGVRDLAHSTYGLAVTGIAGPDGGSDEKPVGLTWIGLATPTGGEAHRYQFQGDREHNRFYASLTALYLLRRHLLSARSTS